jgi:hypothetical protein
MTCHLLTNELSVDFVDRRRVEILPAVITTCRSERAINSSRFSLTNKIATSLLRASSSWEWLKPTAPKSTPMHGLATTRTFAVPGSSSREPTPRAERCRPTDLQSVLFHHEPLH